MLQNVVSVMVQQRANAQDVTITLYGTTITNVNACHIGLVTPVRHKPTEVAVTPNVLDAQARNQTNVSNVKNMPFETHMAIVSAKPTGVELAAIATRALVIQNVVLAMDH